MRAPDLETERRVGTNGHGRDANRAIEPADLERFDSAHVSPIEAVGDTQNCREASDAPAQWLVELTVVAVALLRRRAAMISRDVRDQHLLFRRDAQQVAVQNQ